jgi:hypothetical protein
MKKKTKKVSDNKLFAGLFTLVTVLGLVFLPGAAQAVPMLDFGIVAPTTGSISYSGGVSDPLVGTNIQVDNVSGLGTPVNDGAVISCVGCLLNFTTGSLLGTTSSTWDFGGGSLSTITIIGGIDLDGGGIGPGDIPLGTPLLTGSFGTATVASFGPTFRIAGSAFSDTKNEDLLAFYGLSPGPFSGNFNISFNAVGSPPGGFQSSMVLSGDVLNTAVQVSEPASLLLLGSGLVVLGLWGRRRSRLKTGS